MSEIISDWIFIDQNLEEIMKKPGLKDDIGKFGYEYVKAREAGRLKSHYDNVKYSINNSKGDYEGI